MKEKDYTKSTENKVCDFCGGDSTHCTRCNVHKNVEDTQDEFKRRNYQYGELSNKYASLKYNLDEINILLKDRIKSCYKQLLWARGERNYPEKYIEGFRCRLDELILLYQQIHNVSFIEACKSLEVKYEDVNIGEEKLK